MYWLFIGFAASVTFAVDLGSQNVRIGVSGPGKPAEIKVNERDMRWTPNYLAMPLDANIDNMTAVPWIVGSEAERVVMRNASHGIKNPTWGLWRPSTSDFHGMSTVSTSATAMYYYLKGMKPKVDKIALLVPAYAPPQYRQLLMLTTKLTGFKAVTVLDTSTAVATFYSVERIKKGSRKPVSVLFVDIGAENVEASLWRYKPLGERIFMELAEYRHMDGVGGNYVDKLLLEWAKEQLNKPLVGSETYILLGHLRKAKERLASGRAIDVNLNEDFGVKLTITQELIRSMVANMSANIKEMLTGMTIPEEIELVGGGSRLQAFVDAVSFVFPDVSPRRSLNSDEAAALGGSYYAALKSGSIIGPRLELKKPSVLGLNTAFDGNEVRVFEPGELIKDKKMKMRGNQSHMIQNVLAPVSAAWKEFSTTAASFHDIKSNFNSLLIEGFEQLTSNMKDATGDNSESMFTLKFGLSPELECADLLEVSMSVTRTVPRKGKNRAARTTKGKDVEMSLISIPTDVEFRIPANASEYVKSVMSADLDRRDLEESCHKLEAFIIETRDHAEFDSEMATVTTSEERDALMKELDISRGTIDCTMLTNETAKELDRRLNSLRKKFKDPLLRYEELQQRPNWLRKLSIALKRGYAAKEAAICSDSTLEKFEKLMNKTQDKLDKLKNDGPLAKPSYLVEDMKKDEKNILKDMAELRRPPPKSEIVNYSSQDADNLDEDEVERLNNVGIKVDNNKKKRKQDEDPAVKAEKEAKLHGLQLRYNASRKLWNATKEKHCRDRKDFETQHMLPKESCEFLRESTGRSIFDAYEKLIAREEKRRRIEREKIEEEARLVELERLRLEEEARRTPTPMPNPEEAERMRIEREEAERTRKLVEDARLAIENERKSFWEVSAGMFDEEKLNQQDDDVLYERYKELKKTQKRGSRGPFGDDSDREKYANEKLEYERLRRRFENDPVRKKAEQEKKQKAKRKRQLKEERQRNMTALDVKIVDAESDLRRLEYDEVQLREDMADFDLLKFQLGRKLSHDHHRLRRIQKRGLLERKRKRVEWDEWAVTRAGDLDLRPDDDKPLPGDTLELIETALEYYSDVEVDAYDSSFYDNMEGIEAPREVYNDADLESDEDSDAPESSDSGSTMDDDERDEMLRVEKSMKKRALRRRAIDPSLRTLNFTDIILPARSQKSIEQTEHLRLLRGRHRDPRAQPSLLYKARFATENPRHPERYRRADDPPPKDPDASFAIHDRDLQEDELSEEL